MRTAKLQFSLFLTECQSHSRVKSMDLWHIDGSINNIDLRETKFIISCLWAHFLCCLLTCVCSLVIKPPDRTKGTRWSLLHTLLTLPWLDCTSVATLLAGLFRAAENICNVCKSIQCFTKLCHALLDKFMSWALSLYLLSHPNVCFKGFLFSTGVSYVNIFNVAIWDNFDTSIIYHNSPHRGNLKLFWSKSRPIRS